MTTSSEQAPVVVVGGSVAGLGTALFLARQGRRSIVLDRDPSVAQIPLDPDPPIRRATPQAAHSHIFVARLRRLLLDRAPDVLERLLTAGVREVRLRDGLPPTLVERDHPDLDDPDLVALAARRTTLELALRAAVLDEPLVEVRGGVAVVDLELAATAGGPPRVVAVRTDAGEVLAADQVVDASGRRTTVPALLAARGVEASLSVADCGISYLSRFYRLRPGVEAPALNRGFTAGASFDRYSCLVFPGDDGTFSVTFGTLPEDAPLRGLLDPVAFDRAVASLPLLAPWVAPGRSDPISEVRAMNGLKNRERRWVADGAPVVLGLASVGDAAATSNPAHSRGCTLALVHAAATVDALAAHGGDAVGTMLALDAVLSTELAPWVHDSVEQDAVRLARWREGAPPAPAPRADRLGNGEAYAAAQVDPVAWRRFSRLQNLLEAPDDVLGDPAFVAHVRSLPRPALPPAVGPSHDELVALVAAATGLGAAPVDAPARGHHPRRPLGRRHLAAVEAIGSAAEG